tara:strand:+ start:277 stop:513 length:237 start_codon:yes stop_codon:yes gene_type:complete
MYLLIVMQLLTNGGSTQPEVFNQYNTQAACEKFLGQFAEQDERTELAASQVGRVTAIRHTDTGVLWATCAKDSRGDRV